MNLRAPAKTLVFLAFVACGGALTPNLGGGDAGDPAGDGGSTDGRTADGRAGDAGTGNRCDQLLKEVEALRPKVLQCCFTCNAQQCDDQIPDLCCPISVSHNNPNIDAFSNAVQAVKDNGCGVACPAIPCRGTASLLCNMTATGGRCVP